jgi:hypothetical protein
MTALTRRDALLLTAAATASTAAVQQAAAAAGPPTQSSEQDPILEVPTDVADASSVPITIRIPAKNIAPPTGDSLKNVTVKLSLQKAINDSANDKYDVFTATFTESALPKGSYDMVLMTSLKIAYDPYKEPPPSPPAGTSAPPPAQFTVYLLAVINVNYTQSSQTFVAQQSIVLLPSDCAPSAVAVLRLGLQPPSVAQGNPMLVRTFLPAVPIPYLLNTITCTNPDDASLALFEMDINQGNVYLPQKGVYAKQPGVYIADEVSVSFNLFPSKNGIVKMIWDYHNQSDQDKTKTIDLIATGYVVTTPSAT